MAKDHVASMEAKLRKKKKSLLSENASNAQLKKKFGDVIDWAKRVDKRAKSAKTNTLKAIDDYKKLTTLE